MKANMSHSHEYVTVYNKKEELVWAGRTKVAQMYFGKKLVDILYEQWEYKSPYHDDKAQLEIPFNS